MYYRSRVFLIFSYSLFNGQKSLGSHQKKVLVFLKKVLDR